MANKTVVAGVTSVSSGCLAGTRIEEGARAAMRAHTPQVAGQSTKVGVAMTENEDV